MKLNVSERLAVLELLPTSGSFLNLKLVREAREDLSFTEKETQKLEFVTDAATNTVRWVGDIEREFTFGPTIIGMVSEALAARDKKELLEFRHLSIYPKFITGEK